jgi:hypothetical protein
LIILLILKELSPIKFFSDCFFLFPSIPVVLVIGPNHRVVHVTQVHYHRATDPTSFSEQDEDIIKSAFSPFAF